MKLEFEDYELGKKIVDEAMKLPDADIEFYLENSVEAFIVAGDLTNFEFRCKIRLFLGHLSTLFLNYSLNGDVRTNPDGYRIYFNVFVSYATSTSKKSLDYKFDLPVSEYRSFIRLSKIESILNNE